MFTLEIETENAAFEKTPGREIARVLRRLADRLEGGFACADGGKLMDVNGNSVGNWSLK